MELRFLGKLQYPDKTQALPHFQFESEDIRRRSRGARQPCIKRCTILWLQVIENARPNTYGFASIRSFPLIQQSGPTVESGIELTPQPRLEPGPKMLAFRAIWLCRARLAHSRPRNGQTPKLGARCSWTERLRRSSQRTAAGLLDCTHYTPLQTNSAQAEFRLRTFWRR